MTKNHRDRRTTKKKGWPIVGLLGFGYFAKSDADNRVTRSTVATKRSAKSTLAASGVRALLIPGFAVIAAVAIWLYSSGSTPRKESPNGDAVAQGQGTEEIRSTRGREPIPSQSVQPRTQNARVSLAFPGDRVSRGIYYIPSGTQRFNSSSALNLVPSGNNSKDVALSAADNKLRSILSKSGMSRVIESAASSMEVGSGPDNGDIVTVVYDDGSSFVVGPVENTGTAPDSDNIAGVVVGPPF